MKLDLTDKNVWENCKQGPNEWRQFMGLEPEYHDGFVRFNCVKDGSTYKTAGIQTKELLGDGIVEAKVRFHGGDSSWPAVWLINERASKYYEIDIAEYFDNDGKVKSGVFMPKHMSSKLKRLFRPKENTKVSKTDWVYLTCFWNEKWIKIFVNGKEAVAVKNDGNWKSFPQTEEDRKFNLFLSMQYAHGKPKPSQLPLWMDVEYVNYYPKLQQEYFS